MNLEDIARLYSEGFLTRGELYERVLEAEDLTAAECYRVFGHAPELIEGMERWATSVLNGARAFGGEWSRAELEETALARAQCFSSDLQARRDASTRAPRDRDRC